MEEARATPYYALFYLALPTGMRRSELLALRWGGCGSRQGSGFGLQKLEGSPFLPNTVTHAWIKLARRIGFEGIRLHDARHTHATVMLKQGVASKGVQERLGHSTVAITRDVYSHVAPGMQEAAALRFDEVVAGGIG